MLKSRVRIAGGGKVVCGLVCCMQLGLRLYFPGDESSARKGEDTGGFAGGCPGESTESNTEASSLDLTKTKRRCHIQSCGTT